MKNSNMVDFKSNVRKKLSLESIYDKGFQVLIWVICIRSNIILNFLLSTTVSELQQNSLFVKF